MAQILKNNVSGALSTQLNPLDTSMVLVDASNFPAPLGGDFYLLTLVGLNTNGQEDTWEVVKVTAKASNTLTVVRAQESTAAATWPAGATVQLRLTAGTVATQDALASGLATKEPAIAVGTTAQYRRGDKTWQTLDKAAAGLANVDNTADATKAVLSATKLTTARTINGVSFDGSANISINAAAVPNTPAGSIAATTVQAAINELDSEKVSTVVVLPDATDLDTVVTSGFHRLRTVSNGPPVAVTDGQLIVSRGADTITQIAINYGSGRMFTRSGNPPSVGGVGTFTPWREVYTAASILGAVSQSAGVPTGAVIEQGSNANGEYVRFADGTQICRMTGNFPAQAINTGASLNCPFPATFSSAVYKFTAQVTGNSAGSGSQNSVGSLVANGIYKDASSSATQLALASYSYRYAVETGNFLDITVTGRWF